MCLYQLWTLVKKGGMRARGLRFCCSYNVGKALPKGQPALPWQGGQHTNSTAPVVPLSNDDFVAAIVTDDWHEKMAHAGRAWRQVIGCPVPHSHCHPA